MSPDLFSLPREQWEAAEDAHRRRADDLTRARRERAARGRTHPVDDFLFTYYSYKPAVLRRWHPGLGVELQDAAGSQRARWRWYRSGSARDALVVDGEAFAREKPELLRSVLRILRLTSERPGRFGCFGLHEWAMVYRQDGHRHPIPLRLGQDGTDAVVEAHELRCTHYDAFRFFTPEAAPRNELRPTRERQAHLEQPGCLHAGMDVYKWIVKLGPLVPGPLLLDAFALAQEIRTLDMAASPYDLQDWGVVAVPVETPEGKSEYGRRQREFAGRANALRVQVLEALAPLATSVDDAAVGAGHEPATPGRDR